MFHIAALVLIVALIAAVGSAIGVYGAAAIAAGTVRMLFMSILAFALLFHMARRQRGHRVVTVPIRNRPAIKPPGIR